MAQSLKNLKQDFVSNLTGGTINEINLVTAVAPVIPPDGLVQLVSWLMAVI